MGALKTAGSGCVAPLGLPSGEAMETVGREAIVSCWLVDDEGVVVSGSRFVEIDRRRRNIEKVTLSGVVD
jgi:hypothetical protein